jgi:hypothetical protein
MLVFDRLEAAVTARLRELGLALRRRFPVRRTGLISVALVFHVPDG